MFERSIRKGREVIGDGAFAMHTKRVPTLESYREGVLAAETAAAHATPFEAFSALWIDRAERFGIAAGAIFVSMAVAYGGAEAAHNAGVRLPTECQLLEAPMRMGGVNDADDFLLTDADSPCLPRVVTDMPFSPRIHAAS